MFLKANKFKQVDNNHQTNLIEEAAFSWKKRNEGEVVLKSGVSSHWPSLGVCVAACLSIRQYFHIKASVLKARS